SCRLSSTTRLTTRTSERLIPLLPVRASGGSPAHFWVRARSRSRDDLRFELFEAAHPYNLRVKAFVLLLAAARLFAQSLDSAAVDSIIRGALAASHTPGAGVAIVQGDRVTYLKGHGVRELGRGELVTPDTLFCVGSLTKAFTATGIAMMVDE